MIETAKSVCGSVWFFVETVTTAASAERPCASVRRVRRFALSAESASTTTVDAVAFEGVSIADHSTTSPIARDETSPERPALRFARETRRCGGGRRRRRLVRAVGTTAIGVVGEDTAGLASRVQAGVSSQRRDGASPASRQASQLPRYRLAHDERQNPSEEDLCHRSSCCTGGGPAEPRAKSIRREHGRIGKSAAARRRVDSVDSSDRRRRHRLDWTRRRSAASNGGEVRCVGHGRNLVSHASETVGRGVPARRGPRRGARPVERSSDKRIAQRTLLLFGSVLDGESAPR